MKETDEWLASMRSAWKAGIDRDEREASGASARRLGREVTPDKARPMLRDLVALAACIVVCVLGGTWLRRTMTASRVSSIHSIRADEAAREPPPAAITTNESPAPTAVTAAPGASPTASGHPVPSPSANPAKAKSESGALPPLPPPTNANANDRADDERTKMRKRLELRIDRSWRRHPPAPSRRPSRGHVHEL